MKKLYIFLVFLSVFFNAQNSAGSSVWGADITWECLGNDSFKVILTVYSDCNGTSFGSEVLTAKCATNGVIISSDTTTPNNPIDITPVCSQGCTRCTSSGCTFKYGVQKLEYIYLIDLSNADSNCCKVTLSWSTCCRSGSITTGAASQDFYAESTLNRCVEPCDNSPKFVESVPTIVCKGQDQSINLGAFDTDVDSNGRFVDSLAFSLTKPLTGENSSTSWSGSYNYDNVLFYWGFPKANLPLARGFHLDPETGLLAFRPMKEEASVIAVSVKQFRDGKEISEIRRDMQIVVIDCPNNSSPQLDTLATNTVCEGTLANLEIKSDDLDGKRPDTTYLEFYKGNLPGNIFWSDSNGMAVHSSGVLSWIPDASHVGNTYTFYVKAKDDVCPINGTASKAYQVKVVENLAEINKYSVVQQNCNRLRFSADSVEGNSLWLLEGENTIYANDTFSAEIDSAQWVRYDLKVVKNGCYRQVTDSLFSEDYKPEVVLQNDTVMCYKDTLSIIPLRVNQKPSVNNISYYLSDDPDSLSTFEWIDLGSNSQIQASKNIALMKSGKYLFKVTNAIGCSAADSISITHIGDIDNFLPSDTSLCKGDSMKLKAIQGYTYEWNNDSTEQDENIWVKGDSTYLLKLSYGSCNWTDSVTIDMIQFPEIFAQDSVSAMDSVVLTAPSGYSYLWSTGSTGKSITVKSSGDYWVELKKMGCTERASVHVVIQHTIGLGKKLADQIKIYPNPANDHLTVELTGNDEPFSYEILTIEGKVQMTGRLINKVSIIDIAKLSDGAFILEVMKNQSTSRILLIKN